MASQRDGFVVGFQLPLVVRQRCFRLGNFELGANPALQPPTRPRRDFLLLLERRLSDVAQRKPLRQTDVRAHHIRFEFELRSAAIGGACVGCIQRAFRRVLIAAKEVEVIRQLQRGRVVPGVDVVVGTRTVIAIFRPLLTVDHKRSIDLGRESRLRHASQRTRFAHACGGQRERRTPGLRTCDPRVELGIVVGAPPGRRRPCRVGVSRAQRRAGIERRRVLQGIFGTDVFSARAACYC